MSQQPEQPTEMVNGILRYKVNKVVRHLLDIAQRAHVLDLNKIWLMYAEGEFTRADMKQFYQLIGYSVSGYGDVFCDDDEEEKGVEPLQIDALVDRVNGLDADLPTGLKARLDALEAEVELLLTELKLLEAQSVEDIVSDYEEEGWEALAPRTPKRADV
jgi:hypothetical protein